MTDMELIKALEEQEGGAVAAARALGIAQQVWGNWKKRGGIPENAHLRAWLALNKRALLNRWLAERKAA